MKRIPRRIFQEEFKREALWARADRRPRESNR